MKSIFALIVFVFYSIRSIRAFCPIGCMCLDDDPTSPSVDCDGANLDSIPILLNPRIRSLTLSNNRISSVTLDELGFYTELEFLDLSNNKILSIERGAFYRLQKLKALKLNSNLLASLGVETFAGLNELRALDLSDNGLNRLATSIFSDLRRLETLNVSKNALAHISPGALTGLTSLKELHMQHNELTSMPKIALHAPQSLKILDLSYNRLETIGDESFVHLKQLETLNLAGNDLHTIDENAFAGLRNLRQLNLDTNRLLRVPTISFRPLTELDSLSLSENLIDELTTSAFEGLSRLRQLTISRCPQLKTVSINAFSGLFTLESLVLSENRALSSIDPMAFELLQRSRINNAKLQTSLRQLYIFGNNLTSLPSELLPWRQLNEFDLRSNPWICDCEFGSWVGQALRRVYGQRRSYPDGAQCSGPDNIRGRHLHTIRVTSKNKDDDDDYVWMELGSDGIELTNCRSVWSNATIDMIVTVLSIIGCLLFATVFIFVCVRYRRRICNSCCCANDILPTKTKPPPPGLPELFRHTVRSDVRDLYSGSCVTSCETDGLYVGDEDEGLGTDFSRIYSSTGCHDRIDYAPYCRPTNASIPYVGYVSSASETRSFLPKVTALKSGTPFQLYTNTSDYYSGHSSAASHSPPSTSSQISPSAGPVQFGREGSFRVIQRYPVPITEL